MRNKWLRHVGFIWLVIAAACSSDESSPLVPPGNIPPAQATTCKMDEIEFRNGDDQIIGIREFSYNVIRGNRMESISIIEDTGTDILNLRFQLQYHNDESSTPFRMQEVFGGDIISSIDFRYDASGNLTEFTQFQQTESTIPPESHVFFYESTEQANDSINTRIIIFNIERLIQDWIDVLPAIFTTGEQRITRFDRISFRGDLLEYCDFSYNNDGFLEQVVCRNFDDVLTEVWDFVYRDVQLISAYRQLPNFRALTEYEYDRDGKPSSVVSTTDGRFNWSGRYFYLCR